MLLTFSRLRNGCCIHGYVKWTELGNNRKEVVRVSKVRVDSVTSWCVVTGAAAVVSVYNLCMFENFSSTTFEYDVVLYDSSLNIFTDLIRNRASKSRCKSWHRNCPRYPVPPVTKTFIVANNAILVTVATDSKTTPLSRRHGHKKRSVVQSTSGLPPALGHRPCRASPTTVPT